jgi:DNA uptake protein and related DNA-binding proteins
LVARYPAIARELRIGRPDLSRGYDDGGLVDINSAPFMVIVSLPGITPEQAWQIIADRESRGALTSIEDLVTRDLVPRGALPPLREALVILPPN